MLKVKLIAVQERFDGTACYDHSCHNLDSKSKNPYARDRWFYDIQMFGISCSDDKRIIEVGGYEPYRNWIASRSIEIPEPRSLHNFVIDEPFDQSIRCAREETDLRVEVWAKRGVVKVSLADAPGENVAKIFVSPHDNLLVGATDADPMMLTEFILLNVTGIDHL